MLEHFDVSQFVGVVLDESSILKHKDGKTRTALIEACINVPYKLSCTATPSPNDHMELGNQAEFIGVMSTVEMLAMYFTHDGGSTSKWRLKGHGASKFWEWLSTWAVCIRKPSDIGYEDTGYNLPELKIIERAVPSKVQEGALFVDIEPGLQGRNKAKRDSIDARANLCASLINGNDDTYLVWCHLNDESDKLAKLIVNGTAIKGSDTIDKKERAINSFSDGSLRVLITKPSIAGFGMNWQHCNNMIFVGVNDSFEQFYQAVRRCYRFGQTKRVTVTVIRSEAEGAVVTNMKRKEGQHQTMSNEMVKHMRRHMEKELGATVRQITSYNPTQNMEVPCFGGCNIMKVINQIVNDNYAIYHGDCVDVVSGLDNNSVDYTIFSPPFASLYTYSNSDYDMGNCKDDETFYNQFAYLVKELYRVTNAGRLLSFHCMNLPTSKTRHGYIGINDFRGKLIEMFQAEGWIFHSEVVIWKDPVTAMQRTKALGLLHKQIKKDSCMSRQGIPDYLVTMRKPGVNEKPVTHTNESFPVGIWQQYASPIWTDINPSDTLQYRSARDNNDERHICPLQLEVIRRGVELWSNPDDIVLSPFAGIGSEGYVALQHGRKFIGVELKESYYNASVTNLQKAASQTALFTPLQKATGEF